MSDTELPNNESEMKKEVNNTEEKKKKADINLPASNLVEDTNNAEPGKFSLDNLSKVLTLSVERSKSIYDLYEKNSTLKEESTKLVKELDEEKKIVQLQSEFVSLVSHEFRTPLAIIKASADLLKMSYGQNDDPEFFHNQIFKINKAVIRMNKLIESTFNLSKLESGNIEFSPITFCPKKLIEEITDRFKEINPEFEIIDDIQIEDKKIHADKNLIEQIFSNLISNAIKYSKDAQKIMIAGRIIDDKFVFKFQDFGIGIDEKEQPQVFSKFFRSKNALGIAGTGVGLYLVKRFVELHHGNISVESIPNKGSIFTVILPTT